MTLDEWENFLERIGQDDGDAEPEENSAAALERRFWVSYRGQTLARTGFMSTFLIFWLYLVKILVD